MNHRVKKQIPGIDAFRNVETYLLQRVFSRIIIFIGVCIFLGCAATPPPGRVIEPEGLKDGIYKGSYWGWPNRAVVSVTIAEGKIKNIDVLKHQAWRGGIAEGPVVESIIATQSTSVDAVSGATNSSRVIMNAVQNAIEKAYFTELGR